MQALRALDQSLSALEATASAYLSDLPNASPELVLARSDRIRGRCAAADSAAATTQPLVAAHKDVRTSLSALRGALSDCQNQFQTGRATFGADSLRAWAPHRLARLGDVTRRYRLAAQPLLH
ncbi:MAG TPA: hypothetical protein VLT79_00490 [Gemmatimonadales bacterium]|nr:hypothetical protein [Gemmatimonadales bacterium]